MPLTTIELPKRKREVIDQAVIRFCGDSGDGMQITGSQFTNTVALYGNDLAVRFARSGGRDYPPGSVLSLVTWTKQDDDRWFGARIPGQVKSVEFVSASAGPNSESSYFYERYEGSPLTRTSAVDGRSPTVRAEYLLCLRASVMP